MSKTVQIRLVAGIAICLLALSAEAQYNGGSGTVEDPYQIATAADLIALGEQPDDYDKHFILTADIDVWAISGRRQFDRAVIAPDVNDDEYWFQGTAFTGVFDGNGHTISHLTIEGGGYLGLFGQTGSGARISNLGLEAVDVNGTGDYVGGLVGDNNGSITTSYSTGSVSSGKYYVGGLVGSNGVWGLIMLSYRTGSVTGYSHVGGLVGYNRGSITTSYSTGSVSGDDRVGGLVGRNFGTITSSFWNIQTSGQTTSAGGTGLTTAEMQTANVFLQAGWDFVGENENGPNDVWKIIEGQTYPLLSWQKFGGGTGDPNVPYLIGTAEHLNALGAEPNDYDKHFKLIADIDLSGYTYERAVIAPDENDDDGSFQGTAFTGLFNGNGHTISHLTIEGGGYLGLFGQLQSPAEVKNLGVVDANITGSRSYVGGLVGYNDEGSITTCHSSGTVTEGDHTGGLVGVNTGSITESFSGSTVTGDDTIGGLVGYNGLTGHIATSYSTGTVNGDGWVGGLVGRNFGTITSSFWNIQTSGQTTSAGGTGLTTAEMQTANVFLQAGWDFVGENQNGPNDVWTIIEGQTYPLLSWQKFGGGTGDPDDPYLIYTAEHLNALGAEPNDYDKHFKLMADIDLSGYTYERAVIAPDENDDERRFQGTAFTGVFDGNDHTISHLTIEGGGYLGLFGQTGSGARISNLGLEAVDVSGTGDCVGGLVGYKNEGSVTSCYSTGAVTGNDEIGGLVGENNGRITTSSIAMSYNTGTVTGHFNVGGLVGVSDGSIATSYSTGSVTGEVRVGGLVGYNSGSITSSYNTGSVSGNDAVGGLVGTNDDICSITMSYSTGRIYAPTDNGGGLVGFRNGGHVASCFWDMETSGQSSSADGTGLTTAEMQDINTYLSEGWDFADEILNGTCDYWQISPGEYPRLRYQDSENLQMPEGLGTAEQPYLIRDARDLGTVWLKPLAHYRLEASLDLSATTWSMAVVPRFDGTFDGNGHVISNLHIQGIQGSRYLGLFGLSGYRADISNLGLEAVDVNGVWVAGGLVAGGLVAANRGSITSCYSTGGGLVGSNSGSITSSYSTGGGLVRSMGSNIGSITSSVWDMETSGSTVSGGGVGLTTAEMMNPYMLGLNGFANDPNWVLDAGRDYPRLAWEGTAGQIIPEPEPIIDWLDGQGTDQEPYRIDTADQLILLSRAGALWDKHFILGADIDLDPNLQGRQVFSQAIIQVFSGVFDGNDHTISHLTIRGGSFLGLFGQTGSGAKISNLALEAVDIDKPGEWVSAGAGMPIAFPYIGGLVGSNSGSVSNCYSTGTVNGGGDVGGLAGYNDGTITTSYSTGSVYGIFSEAGGLVGVNAGRITTCYSTGSARSYERSGGLVGHNFGTITSSYSTGTATSKGGLVGGGGLVGYNEGRITSSFWDMETSGRATSGGGTGVTTAEMQTASTFLEAGWDFVDETTNGTDDIWWIPEGRGYPRLWWENLYVDDDAPDDPGPGDPEVSDPLEDGSKAHPFDTIQEAIDAAPDCLTVLVHGGVYGEPIDFKGKAITVKSRSDVAVLEAPGDYAVSFYSNEGSDSILQNFVIRNSVAGIFIPGSSPTIRNLTVVDNEYGITAYTWAEPDISNCIFWNNSEADLFQCEARYSCIEDGGQGQGNISADPLFVDAENGDYHLKSEGWCWSTKTKSWTYDYVTSRCIDAGNPGSPLGDELMSVPRDPDNQWGANLRINMGAFGGTPQASISPHGSALLADLNNDGHVNCIDLAEQVEDWLGSESEQAGDLNRDGVINMADFALLAENWLEKSY